MEPADSVAVYYDLTAKGEVLLDALAELDDWSQRWGGTGSEAADEAAGSR